jgi:hypothetical protein
MQAEGKWSPSAPALTRAIRKPNQMTQATRVHSTPRTNTPISQNHPVDAPSRRRLLSQAAGVAAGSAVLALATSQPIAAASAPAAQLNESTLLKLEEQIFEQYQGATAYDDEIVRLAEIWRPESRRLYEESLSREVQAGTYLTPQQRWALVTDMPERREHERIVTLQEPFYERMDALVKQMFATPAHTAEGRRAKAIVLLGVILDDRWRCVDAETDYPEMMARRLLIEFVGGEPGEMLRDQFA